MRAPRYIERGEVIGGMRFLNPIRKDEMILAHDIYDTIEGRQAAIDGLIPWRFLDALDREYGR